VGRGEGGWKNGERERGRTREGEREREREREREVRRIVTASKADVTAKYCRISTLSHVL